MCASRFILSMALSVAGLPCMAQPAIPIWGDETPPYHQPHALEEYEDPDCWGGVRCLRQVVDPTLTIFPPSGEGNGSAVLVLPGGGYEAVAVYHEGHEIARALASRGTAAAVLKYRLPNPGTAAPPELAPLSDLRRALALLREKQADFGFSARRFGVMGFSAGSHLATWASVDRSATAAENPDFSMLIYGVTRMTPENRQWLEETLYHRKMTAAEIAEQTILNRVTADTPPAFLVHALDDEECHYSESTLYAEALTRHGVEAELHLFARGGHGFGAGRAEDGTSQWLDLAAAWLDRLASSDDQ